METKALGPTFAGGMQPVDVNGYPLMYYPDVNNDALQREGKSPVFYWLPNYVHIARKNGQPDGDLMVTMIRFAGVQSGDTTVGVAAGETREVAGGVFGVTVSSAPPKEVLIESQRQITEMFRGKTDFFWGIRSNAQPVFRPVPIVSNETSISNLSPGEDGTHPAPAAELPSGNGTAPAGGGTPPGGGNPPGGGRSAQPMIKTLLKNTAGDVVPVEHRTNPRVITPRQVSMRSLVNSNRMITNFSRQSVPFRELAGLRSRAGLDPWFWKMQGQGKGPIDPMGQDSYTALLGAYPTAILWESFHGAYTPIFVDHLLKVKFWTPQIELTIRGNWDRVFEHFSAHAQGRYLWFSADVKAELNNMRISGGIEVEIKIDETIPGGEKIKEMIEKRTDMVYEKFMEIAKTVIFDPPQPDVPAAQSSGGSGLFGLWGGGLALKYRRDETRLNLYYHETRQICYLQEVPISGSLEGLADEIRQDPEAERKYFHTVYLDDWPRKLGRICKPVVNWNSQPVAFVSTQIGYPNTRGEINWVAKTFQPSDPDDATWSFGMTQKQQDDVSNAPAGWKPDVTYLKRSVHMKEPPGAFDDIYSRMQIEDNVIALDQGPNGSAINEVTVEVRADDAGKIQVGPISLGIELENSKQVVEITLQATDENGRDLTKFSPVKFEFKFDDQDKPRYWSVFTADQSVRAFYKYQVRVIVKGSLFTKGMEWTGPWTNSIANGPLMVSVPTPEDPGVVVRRSYRPPSAVAAPASPAAPSTPGVPVSSPGGAPPSRTGRVEPAVEGIELGSFEYLETEGREAPQSASSSSAAMPPSAGQGRQTPPSSRAKGAKTNQPERVTAQDGNTEITSFEFEE